MAFSSRAGDRLATELEPVEAALLTQLASQVAGLLSDAADHDRPEDAAADRAVLRLLPDAYPGDEEASAEFRRYTSADLTAQKVRNAQTVIADVADALVADDPTEIVLGDDQVQAWLRSLTDIRLVLATRLGIEQDGDVAADDDEAFMLGDVYDWLGWVQDSLVTALDRR